MATDYAKLFAHELMRLFELPVHKNAATDAPLPEAVRAAAETQRKIILDDLPTRRAKWFDDEIDKLDNWAEDKRAGLKADLKDIDEEIKALKKEVRQTGNLPDKLALQRKARLLEAERDEASRAYNAAAKDIEVQKDGLLDQVEARLVQAVSDEGLFAIRFQVK